MQYYKGDEQENKFQDAAAVAFDPIDLNLNDFFNGAFSCYVLGDIIWDSKRSPLASAIPKAIFREAFPEIYDSFLEAGSFEGYLSVFNKIFGPSSEVVFTIPGPGKLNIDILADQILINNLVSRYIDNNNYVFDELITQGGDNIVIQSIKGMESQYEVEQMLYELVPNGIFTQISLTIGT